VTLTRPREARSTTGDREESGRIVARYQTLVCSLAHNRTGDLAHSEGLAQEALLAASGGTALGARYS